MELQTLKVSYKYEMTLPVSGKKVAYRAFLVKEEKIFLVAKESTNPVDALIAMRTVLENCLDMDNVRDLPLPDIEYAFLHLRAKSVGEMVNVSIPCKKCEKQHDMEINLENVQVSGELSKKTRIELNELNTIDVKVPSLEDMIRNPGALKGSDENKAYAILEDVIDVVHQTDDKGNQDMGSFHEFSPESRVAFIESFARDQIALIQEFAASIPSVGIDIKFTCIDTECRHVNERRISGIQSFFG